MERSPNERLEKMLEIVQEMLRDNVQEAKLVVIEFLALFLASFSTGILMISISMLGLLFLSLGMGFWLNDLLDSNYLGFFVIAGAFVLLMLLLKLIQQLRGIPFFTNSFIRLFVKLFYYGEKKDH